MQTKSFHTGQYRRLWRTDIGRLFSRSKFKVESPHFRALPTFHMDLTVKHNGDRGPVRCRRADNSTFVDGASEEARHRALRPARALGRFGFGAVRSTKRQAACSRSFRVAAWRTVSNVVPGFT